MVDWLEDYHVLSPLQEVCRELECWCWGQEAGERATLGLDLVSNFAQHLSTGASAFALETPFLLRLTDVKNTIGQADEQRLCLTCLA